MLAQKASTRLKLKQKSQADLPVVPGRPVTYRTEQSSSAGQTVINLGFSVPQDATSLLNFFLWVDGNVLRPGAAHDYVFSSVAADNTSSTITLVSAIGSSNLSIIGVWMGLVQSAVSVSNLQAQVNTNSAENAGNALLNSNFDFWQRGTSTTGIANGSSTYGPDRWYVKNSLGTNGILRVDQVAAVTQGSAFGCKVLISTAPTAAQSNGCELYQVLENLQSIDFYGKTASFSALIKGAGNVNQVGVQFFYAASEVKLTTAIGSEVLVTVNSSAFSLGQIVGQAMGTAQGTSGVVGVRIRITGVSSGNTYDINNGFTVEQAIMTRSDVVQTYKRMHRSIATESLACQRFCFQGSWEGTGFVDSATLLIGGTLHYAVPLRVAPTVTFTSAAWTASGGTFDSPLTFSANLINTAFNLRIRTNNPNSRTTGTPGIMSLVTTSDAEI